MKKDKTEIGIILDKSGSMNIIRNDIIGSFNTFVDEQKEIPGECNVWLTVFSDSYEHVLCSEPLEKIERLNPGNYNPGGCTALNDSVYSTINKMGQHFSDMPEEERPEKVLIVIITDGEENASKEVSHEKLSEVIKHQQEKYNWEFMYIGTDDLNVQDIAKSYNIKPSQTILYSRSAAGVSNMTAGFSSYVRGYRTGNNS